MAIQIYCDECRTSNKLDAKKCRKCGGAFVREKTFRVDVSLKGKRITRQAPNLTLAREIPNAEFKELTKYILDRGFNPKQRLHVAEFNADLRHPNAFSSLTRQQCAAAQMDSPPSIPPTPADTKT